MSWQAASFLVLGIGLVLGFAWYERTRPSSSMLALVGTLAAMAALGRMAFAAVPDVKPTTDIVLVAGYTLGGAPGFVVGAVAPLASNVFMGEGTWTPWQMLAWGLVGVGGAALARAGGRRLGRVSLALACAAAAGVFNLIMDLSTWITYTGDLTLGRYMVIEGQALPFNITHVVASLLFFLACGPTLVRALLRFRARLDVRWLPVGAATLLVVALAAVPASAATSARIAALDRQVAYLVRAQNSDGGFGSAPGRSSTQLYTSWAVLGLASARAGTTPQQRAARYIASHQAALQGTGDRERTVLALAAAGAPVPPPLVASILRDQRRNGSVAGQVNLTAFAIFALRASGRPLGDRAVSRARAWLGRQQDPDGGFNFFARGGASGIDDTATALEGLVAAGAARTGVVARAASFMAGQQNPDGGFALTQGADSNAQSTAFAIQGFVAAGRKPAHVRRRGSRSPVAYLESLTAPDGSVRYSRTGAQTPVWVTAQALAGLAERPFPFTARPRAARRALRPPGHTARRLHQRRGASPPVHRQAAVDARAWARLAGVVIALIVAPVGL